MNNLKRIFLVALVAIMACASANAQLKFGIKAGMNVNKLHFSSEAVNDLQKNSTGWEAGVMAEFTVPVIGVGIDAALMYARMNNEEDLMFDNGSALEDASNFYGKNFLEIPVNLKYKLTLPAVASIVKPMIYTGPTFAFKLDKNVWDDIQTHTCQVAWNVGLGLEFFNHLQVAAGYNFGINNIMKYTNLVNAQDYKVKNNYWTVTAAYLF